MPASQPGQPTPPVLQIGNLPEKVLAELHWIASEGCPSLSRHARIILARNEGRPLSEIAHVLDVDRATVRRWLIRFEKHGLRGLVHVRAILQNIKVLVLPDQIAVSKADEAFSPDGSLKDPKRQAAVEGLGAKLAQMIAKLHS